MFSISYNYQEYFSMIQLGIKGQIQIQAVRYRLQAFSVMFDRYRKLQYIQQTVAHP